MIVQLAQTAHFTVFYDDTIVANASRPSGQRLAQSVVDYCEYDYARLSALFGITLPAQNLPVSVTIGLPTPKYLGGASNDGFNSINVYVTSTGNSVEPGLAEPLVAAELAEIFMAAQDKGWVSFGSNGEALSRVSGQILSILRTLWGLRAGSIGSVPRPIQIHPIGSTSSNRTTWMAPRTAAARCF